MGVVMVPPWKACSWWNEKCLKQCLTLGVALNKHHLSIIITILDMTTCKYRLSLLRYSLKFRVWFWSQLEFKHQPCCFDELWGWLSFSASLDVSLPDLWDGEHWCDAVTQECWPSVGYVGSTGMWSIVTVYLWHLHCILPSLDPPSLGR